MPTAPTAPAGLPAAPDPADRTTFNPRAYPWASALPTFGAQLTAVATNAFNNATEAAASASTAAASVATTANNASAAAQSVADAAAQVALAQSAAAMKGAWSSLSGALNQPATVTHAGRVWALLNSLADVTASQPGTTGDWFDVTPSESAYACNHDQAVIPVPVAGANGVLNVVVAVDATRELLIYSVTTGAWAVCYNNMTKQYGAPVLIRTTTANAYPRAILAAADRVLVVSSVTTAFEAVVLSLSGTVITVGTAAASAIPESVSSMRINPIVIGSSIVVGLECTSNLRVLAITVSGVTPTIGASVISSAGTGQLLLLPSGSTSVLAVGKGGTTVFAMPIAVSGVSLTMGTAATTTGSLLTTAVALSTGRFALIYTNTATMGAIVSVAGTVATMTTVALGTGASLNASGVKIGDQIVVAIETSKVNVLTDVAGAATAGVAVPANVGASGEANACGYGSDYAAFALASAMITCYTIIKVSGNNPVVYDTANTTIGVSATTASGGYDGIPAAVLSASGKSGVVVPRVASSEGIPVAYQFGASGASIKMKLLPPIASLVKKSDSVGFSALQQSATSTTIRIHRLELT